MDDFDRQIPRLGTLSRSVETLNEFNALYERALGETVAMVFTNPAGVADGTYRSRLSVLQAIIREQRAWMIATWPREYAEAERQCQAIRDARDRRERWPTN